MESEDIRLLLSSCCSRELITAESLSLRPVAAHILIPGIDHLLPFLLLFLPARSLSCLPLHFSPAPLQRPAQQLTNSNYFKLVIELVNTH